MYVLDTNVLLTLQNHYFPDVFIQLWTNINHMISQNKVISKIEVQEEITSKEHKSFWDNINKEHNNSFYQELISGEDLEMRK
ncbi:MAG: DUF4411 family protein [Methanobrevibacter sp.]|nr:DUF4411 family protein [Methanobrevibacter sp.]